MDPVAASKRPRRLWRRVFLVVGSVVVVLVAVAVVVWRLAGCGSASTRVDELAWLAEAEDIADEFLADALELNELPVWEREEYVGIGRMRCGECSYSVSLKALPGSRAAVLSALEQAATAEGWELRRTPDAQVLSEGTWGTEPGGELAVIVIPSEDSRHGEIELGVGVWSRDDINLWVSLQTRCYPDPVDGAFPDEWAPAGN